jgi:beta-1,4-mannosyl-glycoprotein beta-1,4-N-acetylglucosaminyltransferase
MSKIIDCITFFDENFIFDIRYQILKEYVDEFVVCESKYNHRGIRKKLNFKKKYHNNKKINYIILDKKFPKKNTGWENQALQRDYLLKKLNYLNDNDYIFFSDPDEIMNPKLLRNFKLKKKYGIFMQSCFNYKFNLFNPFESPWEGTRVCKKKNLRSIDYLRQKILKKNLNYSFLRCDKEKNIELFNKGGWHFNNIMKPRKISIKLKTFAHYEFSSDKYSNIKNIKKKIDLKKDLFNRGHIYTKVSFNKLMPQYIIKNKKKFSSWVI